MVGVSLLTQSVAQTLSLRDPHLALILTSEHNYANTRPILLVQRPITFHSVSLACIRSVPWRYSNHWPRCCGVKFRGSEIDSHKKFCLKKHIPHHTSTMARKPPSMEIIIHGHYNTPTLTIIYHSTQIFTTNRMV